MRHSYVRLKRFNEFNVASWVWTSPPRKVSYLQMQRNAHAVACRDPQVSFLVFLWSAGLIRKPRGAAVPHLKLSKVSSSRSSVSRTVIPSAVVSKGEPRLPCSYRGRYSYRFTSFIDLIKEPAFCFMGFALLI